MKLEDVIAEVLEATAESSESDDLDYERATVVLEKIGVIGEPAQILQQVIHDKIWTIRRLRDLRIEKAAFPINQIRSFSAAGASTSDALDHPIAAREELLRTGFVIPSLGITV